MSSFKELIYDGDQKKVEVELTKEEALLKEKRKMMMYSFGDTKSLIFLIMLVASFVYSLFNTISGWEDLHSGSDNLSIVISIVILVLTTVLPIGFCFVYNSSRRNNYKGVNIGLNLLLIYFKVLRIIIIIAASLIGLTISYDLVFNGINSIITLLILIVLFVALFAYVGMFISYLSLNKESFNRFDKGIESAYSIIVYFTILIIVILAIFLGLILRAEMTHYFDYFNYLTIYGFDILVSVGISILILLYTIFYFRGVDKTIMNYDKKYRKKAIELIKLREAEAETKE